MTRFLRLRDRFKTGSSKPTIPQMLLSLLCMAVNGAIGVPQLFTMHRAFNTAIVLHTDIRFWAWDFIEMVSAIILCIAWLAMVYILQHVYEKEFTRGWIPKTFIIFTCIQLLAYGLVYLYIS